MKKKVIIVSILILILLLAVSFIFRYQIGNVIFNIKMIGVNKDIVIEKRDDSFIEGGYASTVYDYYIDLEKKKIYEVEEFYVFGVTKHKGESGSHYTLTRTKKLNDNEINDIINLTKTEENYSVDNNLSSSPLSSITSSFDSNVYYKITHNGKTTQLYKTNATVLANIINNMK